MTMTMAKKPTKLLTLAELPVSPVVFIEQEHEYFCGMDKLTGVTTMLNAVLGNKYTDIDPNVLRFAADRGTATHIAIQKYECEGAFGGDVLHGTPYEEHTPSALANVLEWQRVRWESLLSSWRTLGAEYLVSNEQDLASKIDLVMQDTADKSIYLADIKTSSELDVERTIWQLSVYAYLFTRQTAYKVNDNVLIIHVRNGVCKPSLHPRKSDAEVEQLIADWRAGVTRAPEQPQVPAELVRVGAYYAELERAVKEATAKRDEFRERMMQLMTEAGVDIVKTDDFTCSLVAATERKGFDYKRMMKEHAELGELFGEYETTTQVKPSIRIIVK